MKFGVMYDFRNPRGAWWKPYPRLLRELLDQIVAVEGMGYDNVWVTEHHFVDDDYNPSVMTAMAAIAARTERIRIGSFVMLMPFQNPLRIAEDGACVDNWSNGRLDLGVGQGYRIDEFSGFCMPRPERTARMAEGIQLVDRLWTEERVTFEGRFSRVKNVTISPRPVQKPRPPIWIGARAEKAVRRAAERGYNLMATIGPDPAIPYRAALKQFGRNPADYSIAQLRMAYVAKSSSQAWDNTQEHIHYMMQHYAKWLGGEAKDAPGDENVWDLTDARELRNSKYAEGLLIGTPEECARKLEMFGKGYACTHFVIASHFPGMDPKKSTQSLELFAKEIMPHFR